MFYRQVLIDYEEFIRVLDDLLHFAIILVFSLGDDMLYDEFRSLYGEQIPHYENFLAEFRCDHRFCK